MKLAVFAALMATALPAPVLAADWVFLSENTGGDKFYIDRQSIRTMPNGYKRAWRRTIVGQPKEFGDTLTRFFSEYDCSGGRDRSLQGTAFKGEEITTTRNTPGEWSYVAPETIGEAMLNFVCYGKR
jgi:hypothetical protein